MNAPESRPSSRLRRLLAALRRRFSFGLSRDLLPPRPMDEITWWQADPSATDAPSVPLPQAPPRKSQPQSPTERAPAQPLAESASR